MNSGTENTTARANASRANGMKSNGPVSNEGKTTAAMNGLKHGLASTSVLLPSETIIDYQTNIDAWATTLHPSSPGEVEMVARIADCNFRLRRLQRLEDAHLAASLEAKVKSTGTFKVLNIAQNASLGMTAMISTIADIRTPCTSEYLANLLTPIAAVIEMVIAADLPVAVTVPIEQVHDELKAQAEAELVPPEIFTKLFHIGGTVVEALDVKVAEMEVMLAAERERIADDLLLGDDKELMKFERHRARINKALDSELARMKVVRELSQGASGSSVGPILVELKVIGQRASPC